MDITDYYYNNTLKTFKLNTILYKKKLFLSFFKMFNNILPDSNVRYFFKPQFIHFIIKYYYFV